MYLPTNYVTPQYNASPNSGEVIPPNGWGIQPVNPAAPQKRGGLGYFDSMDFTTWGLAEWLTVAAGVYFLMSLLGDAKSGIAKVQKVRRRRRRRQQEAEA